MSRTFHLLANHDPESRTGIPRFSGYFRAAFPNVLNVTPGTLGAIEWRAGDVVVTDNHLALLVPDAVPVIVVHHGAAHVHYERDFAWRNEETQRLVYDQRRMLTRPNTRFVAPSAWVADRFREIAPAGYKATVIPHWVPEITGPKLRCTKLSYPPIPVVNIIGDWRTLNKGAGLIDKFREAMPQYEFRQLDFDGEAARRLFYQSADAYLCLSSSEGAPYAVADAEAASLPIVSTHVGNCAEFAGDDWYTIARRHDVEEVANALRAAVSNGRRGASFYSRWTFETWREAWRGVIES